MTRGRLAGTLAAVLTCVTCGGNNATSPSSTSTTSGIQTELFAGSVAPAGESSYAFNVAQAGLVTETLASVTQGSRAASPATLTIGFGVPSGTGCARTTQVDTAAGLTAQLSVQSDPGTYCADVSAPAGVLSSVSFVVRIVHP